MRIIPFAAAMIAACTAAIALGQQSAAPPTGMPSPSARAASIDAEPDDIVVEGYRNRPDRATRTAPPATISATRSRTKYGYSERIAKCATRSKLSSLARLRAFVDGEVNSATYRMAQDRLVRIYITCSESPTLLSFTAPPQNALELGFGSFDQPDAFAGVSGLSESTPLGHSIYDRGAFTIQALKQFAPDLKLTRTQTGDPVIQSRFNLREVPRNRLRLPSDHRYFEVAVCMVRVEPRLSVRLALSDGSAQSGDVQAALIDRARICVGNSRQVSVDPTQFRIYIADAVYRWAVAARGVETLIPMS